MAISSVIVDKIEELSGIFDQLLSRYIYKEFIMMLPDFRRKPGNSKIRSVCRSDLTLTAIKCNHIISIMY
jgi:hypothetical protein